jgi:hypothetical protein
MRRRDFSSFGYFLFFAKRTEMRSLSKACCTLESALSPQAALLPSAQPAFLHSLEARKNAPAKTLLLVVIKIQRSQHDGQSPYYYYVLVE